MPEKMPTYRVDESMLRSKLLGYQVEVNAARCEAIEQEVANLRLKKSISLPKVNMRVAVPALIIVVLTTIICLNLENIKDIFSPAPETKPLETKITPPVAKPTVNVNTQTVAANPVPTPSQAVVTPMVQNVVKVDSAALKKTDSANQEAAKKAATPVMAQPPSDSAAKANNATKQDTSVQRSEPPVKKKKKRRRRNANMDELKKSTLESSGSDDDVVVPN